MSDKKALINNEIVEYDICFSTFDEEPDDKKYFEYLGRGTICDDGSNKNNEQLYFWKVKSQWK